MMKFSTIFWIIVIALGLTLFVIGGDNEQVQNSPSPTSDESSITSPSPTSFIRVTPTSIPDEGQGFEGLPDQSLVNDPPDHSLITGPATCSLSNGKITFVEPGVAIHEGAFISFTNVDHPARLIFWSTSPNDGVLSIGPNIFASQEIPNGKSEITVIVEGNNPTKDYKISARINYGVLAEDGGVLRVDEVNCSGEITVELSYL